MRNDIEIAVVSMTVVVIVILLSIYMYIFYPEKSEIMVKKIDYETLKESTNIIDELKTTQRKGFAMLEKSIKELKHGTQR